MSNYRIFQLATIHQYKGTVYRSDFLGNVQVLHHFSGPDGRNAFCLLATDLAGNVYGINTTGGSLDFGNIWMADVTFQSFTTIRNLTGPDGQYASQTGLIRASDGNIY